MNPPYPPTPSDNSTGTPTSKQLTVRAIFKFFLEYQLEAHSYDKEFLTIGKVVQRRKYILWIQIDGILQNVIYEIHCHIVQTCFR